MKSYKNDLYCVNWDNIYFADKLFNSCLLYDICVIGEYRYTPFAVAKVLSFILHYRMQFITRFYHFTSWRVSIMKQTFTLSEHHISRILSLCVCPSIISLVWYVLWTYIIFDSSSAISFFVLSSAMICSHLNNMQMNLQNRSNG